MGSLFRTDKQYFLLIILNDVSIIYRVWNAKNGRFTGFLFK
jgi:hypothetical protein